MKPIESLKNDIKVEQRLVEKSTVGAGEGQERVAGDEYDKMHDIHI